MPDAEVLRSSVEDPVDEAVIDFQTLRDEIADLKIGLQDYVSYCQSMGIAAYDDDQNILPLSAQRFLISIWGQGVCVVKFPDEEAVATSTYAYLIDFAKQRQLRLLSLVPGCGTINLDEAGQLPPIWDTWFR